MEINILNWLDKIKKFSACSNKVYYPEIDAYICSHCGKIFDGVNVIWTYDHYLPASLNGMTNADNLFPLCKSCNSERGDVLVNGLEYYKYITTEAREKMIHSISHKKVMDMLEKQGKFNKNS